MRVQRKVQNRKNKVKEKLNVIETNDVFVATCSRMRQKLDGAYNGIVHRYDSDPTKAIMNALSTMEEVSSFLHGVEIVWRVASEGKKRKK